MMENAHHYNVIVDFWEWYQRRHERGHGLLARHALDKCEESFQKCEWVISVIGMQSMDRGLDDPALVAGARRSTIGELAAATVKADKVMVF
ncbi:MAG: hypothetical protein ACRELF_24250 [Gemmataceae bacterium]